MKHRLRKLTIALVIVGALTLSPALTLDGARADGGAHAVDPSEAQRRAAMEWLHMLGMLAVGILGGGAGALKLARMASTARREGRDSAGEETALSRLRDTYEARLHTLHDHIADLEREVSRLRNERDAALEVARREIEKRVEADKRFASAIGWPETKDGTIFQAARLAEDEITRRINEAVEGKR